MGRYDLTQGVKSEVIQRTDAADGKLSAPCQIYGPLRQIWYADTMNKSGNKQAMIKEFQTSLQQLNNALVSWLYEEQADTVVMQPAILQDDFSVLMSAAKTPTPWMYHRPSWLLQNRFMVVEAGHGGVNNCLPQSMLKGLALQAKILKLRMPVFLRALEGTSWRHLLNSAEVHSLQAAAVKLRKEAAIWLASRRDEIVAQYKFCCAAFGPAADALEAMTKELEDEIKKLEGKGMLGVISHSALMQAMRQQDATWFEDDAAGFRILSYGAGSTTTYPDRIVEFLPWDTSVAPTFYVQTANELLTLPRESVTRRNCLDLNWMFGFMMPCRMIPMSELADQKFAMVTQSEDGVHFNAVAFVGGQDDVNISPEKAVIGVNSVLDCSYWTELPVHKLNSGAQSSTKELDKACYDRVSRNFVRRNVRPVKLRKPQVIDNGGLLDPPAQHRQHSFDWTQRPDPRDVEDAKVLQVDRAGQ